MLPLTGGVAVAAAALVAVAGRLPGRPGPPTWPQVLGVFGLLVLAGAVRLRFGTRGRGDGDTLDLFEAALGVVLVAAPAGVLVVVVVAAKVVSLAAQRVRGLKLAFNAVVWGCAGAAGSLVLAALRDPGPLRTGDLLPLLPALVVVWLVNATAVLVLLSVLATGGLSRGTLAGKGLHGLWRGTSASLRAGTGLGALLGIGLGIAFAAVCAAVPKAWPALPLALLALHLAARDWAQRRAAQARLVGLQRACATLAGRDLDSVAATTFLSELRVAFACGGAQLHLAPVLGAADRTWFRYGSAGEPAYLVPPDLVDALIAGDRAVRLPAAGADGNLLALMASTGWRDCLAAPVRSRGRVVGVLCTHDRQGWEGFEAGELAVLDAAAHVLGEAVHRLALAKVVKQERAALVRSETRWRALVQHSSDLVLVVTGDNRIGYASPSCDRVLGGPATSLGVRALLTRVHPGDRAAALQVVQEARGRGTGAQAPFELRIAGPRGGWRTLELIVSNLEGDGAVDGVVLNARDVTARRLVEAVHRDQAGLLELVATGAPLSETLGALAGTLAARSAQAACVGLLTTGKPLIAATAGADAAAADELTAVLSQNLERGPAPGRHRLAELSTGERVRLLTVGTADSPQQLAGLALTEAAPDPLFRAGTGSSWPAEEGTGAWLLEGAARIARVAVDHAGAQQRLAHQAAHDALTGLPNRALFLDRLGQALRTSARTGTLVLVLFLDLDRFKTVNDSLGHSAGDALLRAVAGRLRQALRPGDAVARFGGDEFTMLCEGLAEEAGALEVVERVREVLARPFPLGESELFATSSIGLALSSGAVGPPGVERRPETLLEQADAAMYRAKEKGGNRFELFDDGMRDRAVRRLGLQSALHRALERSEFRVHYQPVVDLRSGVVVGVEALARWVRRGHGLVLPAEFIGLAEEDGLIVEIGAQVLEQAFTQAGRWQDAAEQPVAPLVNVNLSTRQLVDPGLVGLVRRALERASVDPASIALEITESALISDVATSTATLAALKRLGVRLYVDDFGTGYSSLAYLQHFPVDGVKIDRSFVADICGTNDAEAIVRAVLGLAATMGLVPVAEGVETPAQVRRLRDLGCQVAQGFYLGRPVTAEQVRLGPRQVHPSGLVTPTG